MAETCQTEIANLPTGTGCPPDTEKLLFMNSNAAGNVGGYILRYVSDVRKCWLNSLKFVLNQFVIGIAPSPMNPGDTQLVVTQSGVLQDSVFITLGGPELPRDPVVDQLSYGVVYGPNGFTINFLNAVQATQLYILHYAYSS